MRPPIIFLSLLLLPSILSAQIFSGKQSGNFSLGVRSTVSAFSHGGREVGYGAGGHFRIQLTDRINTEWFADVLSSNIKDKAQRMDYHVGWSVMYYVMDTKDFTRKITPYVVAGHCFDYTRVSINAGHAENPDNRTGGRFNSAVQAGVGFHYNITPKLDVSPTVQYMLHLGKELHVGDAGETASIELGHAGWEGHLLFNVSINYKFLKLWKRGKKS